MISATRRWFKRNRTPLAIGLGVVGVGYVATQYVLGKISDARERMSSDRIARENLRRRFEQNQEDCTFTVLALLPTATDNIKSELDTERITFELQQQKAARLARNNEPLPSEFGSGPPSVTDDDGRSMASMSIQSESGVHTSQIGVPSASAAGDGPQDGGQGPQKAKKTKLQLWNDLKISAITRAFTLIYTLALLELLTRIQLNLLGRRSYLSSVVSLATGGMEQSTISLENHDDDNQDQAYGNDFETNRRYLTFSWWLLHKGWKEIMLQVQTAVQDVFGSLSPRDDISMHHFSELTLEVRKKVEGATEAERQSARWLQYLLPPRELEEMVLRESGVTEGNNETETSGFISVSSSGLTPLRRLLDETSDLIDSPPFSHVLTLLLDSGYSTLVDQKIAQQAYKLPPPPVSPQVEERVIEVVEPKPVKLPIVLAVLTRQAHSIGNGMPNEYLQGMEQVRDLEAFAAVVYSSNWEGEIAPSTGETVEEGEIESSKEPLVVKDGEGVTVLPQKETGDKWKGKEVEIEKPAELGKSGTGAFESAWGKAVEEVGNNAATESS